MRNKRKVTELVSPIGKYCTAVDLKKTNEELLETKKNLSNDMLKKENQLFRRQICH